MQYRKFGNLDFQVSGLGFGCMRLPRGPSGKLADVDEPEAIKMIRYAVDHGVNYFDCGYEYHDGNSELVLGRALKGSYREKVKVAAKLPCWRVEETKDFDRYLNEQLDRLQIEHLDFYLLHGLNSKWWTKMRDIGAREWAQRAMADGRVGYFGFSFHGPFDAFKDIIDDYDSWTVCQIRYNYMETEFEAGAQGLKYAASKGLAVVVMGPLQGGRLTTPPEAVQKIWDAAPMQRTPVDWALRWLWDQPEVSLALSGMSTMQQLVENVASADRAGASTLSGAEQSVIAQVRTKYESIAPFPCTLCKDCMPCPSGIDIPRLFILFKYGVMYNQLDQWARRSYATIPEQERASACTECRECEERCPEGILISEWMPQVDAVLGQGQPYIYKVA